MYRVSPNYSALLGHNQRVCKNRKLAHRLAALQTNAWRLYGTKTEANYQRNTKEISQSVLFHLLHFAVLLKGFEELFLLQTFITKFNYALRLICEKRSKTKEKEGKQRHRRQETSLRVVLLLYVFKEWKNTLFRLRYTKRWPYTKKKEKPLIHSKTCL